MDSVRIYFKVQDFPKWKKIFDEDIQSGLLEGAGVTKYDLQKLIDSGEPSLYFELKDARKFDEFMKSDICQKRMKEAGVIGQPELEFMQRIEEKAVGGGRKVA